MCWIFLQEIRKSSNYWNKTNYYQNLWLLKFFICCNFEFDHLLGKKIFPFPQIFKKKSQNLPFSYNKYYKTPLKKSIHSNLNLFALFSDFLSNINDWRIFKAARQCNDHRRANPKRPSNNWERKQQNWQRSNHRS